MGPVEWELRQWCREHGRPDGARPLCGDTADFYVGAIGSAAAWMRSEPDWEDAMSEAIEAAEALGL